jgi:hypothetical protein
MKKIRRLRVQLLVARLQVDLVVMAAKKNLMQIQHLHVLEGSLVEELSEIGIHSTEGSVRIVVAGNR